MPPSEAPSWNNSNPPRSHISRQAAAPQAVAQPKARSAMTRTVLDTSLRSAPTASRHACRCACWPTVWRRPHAAHWLGRSAVQSAAFIVDLQLPHCSARIHLKRAQIYPLIRQRRFREWYTL